MFFIKIPFFDLDKTYSTYLCTGWLRVKEGKYFIVDGEHFVTVEQGYSGNFGFSCSEDEFYEHWYKYFNLEVDYAMYNYTIRCLGKSLKRAAVRGAGIRIPQQNLTQTIVRQVFNEMFDDKIAITLEAMFRQAIGTKRRNTIKGAGLTTWYALPSNKDIVKNYKKVTKLFKEVTPRKSKKKIIWCLKTIKAIVSDLEWYGFDDMDTHEVIENLMGYGISLKGAQYICIKCINRHKVFVVDDVTEKAVSNVDDWDEYEDANDFCQWILIDEKESMSAYLNEIIRWDLLNPPKHGDEPLWE